MSSSTTFFPHRSDTYHGDMSNKPITPNTFPIERILYPLSDLSFCVLHNLAYQGINTKSSFSYIIINYSYSLKTITVAVDKKASSRFVLGLLASLSLFISSWT